MDNMGKFILSMCSAIFIFIVSVGLMFRFFIQLEIFFMLGYFLSVILVIIRFIIRLFNEWCYWPFNCCYLILGDYPV